MIEIILLPLKLVGLTLACMIWVFVFFLGSVGMGYLTKRLIGFDFIGIVLFWTFWIGVGIALIGLYG